MMNILQGPTAHRFGRMKSRMIRRLARGAVAFLDWLDAHNRTLGSCQQADLDRWLADEQAVYREEAGRLVCCARSFANQAGRIEADPARHWRPTAIVRPGRQDVREPRRPGRRTSRCS